MNALLYGVLVVFPAILLAVGGLALVQYFVPWQLRRQHNDVAGFIYAVLGVVYAVLLGFTTIVVWEDFDEAKSTTDGEANEVAEIYWLAREFPDPQGERLQDLSRSYAEVVINEEWSMMAQGEESARARALTEEMRLIVQDFQPDTEAEQVLYGQGLERIHDLVDQRRLRLLQASQGMPQVLWGVLVVGGVIVVGFTYLFGLENTRSHTLMIAALAAVIALVLFTIYALDRPYSGVARVHPEPFELVLKTFEQAPDGR